MADGFSQDGYIIDQDFFHAYPYRTTTSDMNGCGWIAAYDLRRALGQTPEPMEVCAEMDAMHRLRVPGPTTTRVMRAYLEKYVPGLVYSSGRQEAGEALCRSRAGILRYWESGVPHFVSFIRQEDGRHRFFNVADGLEDYTVSAAEFLDYRCQRGSVHALTVE